MPYVKRTAAGRISAVFDRPSRDAKERVRANDPELLKFLGLAPTQSVLSQSAPAPPAPSEPTDVAPSDHYAEEDVPSGDWVEESEPYAEPVAVEPVGTIAEQPEAPVSTEAAPVEDLGTDFSLPEDMPEDAPEDDGFADGFDLPAEPPPPPPLEQKVAEAPPEETSMLESGDMPSRNTDDAATAGRSPSAPTASAAPPPPEPSVGDAEDTADANQGEADDSALQQLDASDLEMARITEDLIDLLIGRNIINFTDFPGMAQRKLINRRALRSNMSALTNLVCDEESIF